MAADIRVVESNLGAQRPPIDGSYTVARAQSSSLRRASLYHIINWQRVSSRVIVWVVELIEAELHDRARITDSVHPKGPVKERESGKDPRKCGKKGSGQWLTNDA